MNYRMIGRITAIILAIEAVFMFPAMVICLADGDRGPAGVFGMCAGGILLLALALYALCRKAKKGFYAREGLVCVGLNWILMSALGALPFVFTKAIPHFIDALFETASGFTTTGASILTQIEGIPRGILYWRSFTHWLGGMGVLVFVLAVVPLSGGRSSSGFTMHLLRAESPGPSVGKLVPRIRRTASILYLIYMLLTALCFLFLVIGGMDWFEAICTAFGCAGTGGFGVKNDSIASYSTYLQGVCTVFMLLFGVNFSCYYLVLRKDFRSLVKDEELRTYLGIYLVSVGIIAFNTRGYYDSFFQAFHHAAFQASSIVTTTGFATQDFNLWPSLSKGILVLLMILGSMAGSTGGGFKTSRVVIVWKNCLRSIRNVLHPQKVQVLRMNGEVLDEQVVHQTSAYLTVYVAVFLGSFLLVTLDNQSMTTSATAVVACLNNIGPGLDVVGPTGNYSSLSYLSKCVLIVDMLAGRLELFPILALFSPATWKVR